MIFLSNYMENGIEIEFLWVQIEYQGLDDHHIHGCCHLKQDPGITKNN